MLYILFASTTHFVLSSITKKNKPQEIGGLTDDWDTFVAELFPPEYANDQASSVPSSEPAMSEPSSRPSSRASDLMDIDEVEQDDEIPVVQKPDDDHAVQFGGFEPEDPVVKPAVRSHRLCHTIILTLF